MLSESNISLHSQSHLSNSLNQQLTNHSPRLQKYSVYIGGAPEEPTPVKRKLDAQKIQMSAGKNIRSTPVSSLNSLEMNGLDSSDPEVRQLLAAYEQQRNKYPSRPGSSYSKIPANEGDEPTGE